MVSKTFVAASISKNTNSFGLHGIILLAKDGEAWEAAANSINVPKQHDRVTVALDDAGSPRWELKGYEIPRRLPAAPPKVVAEVWNHTPAVA
jgi:hypothetical protein